MPEFIQTFLQEIGPVSGKAVEVLRANPLLLAPLLSGLAAVICLTIFFRKLLKRPDRTQQRVEGLRAEVDDDLGGDEGIFGGLTPALAAQLPESRKEKTEFRDLLRGAGLYSPSAGTTIYALRFVLLFVPLVVAGALAVLGDSRDTFRILIVGVVCAAVLSTVPRLYVFFRRRRRLREIREGLPDTMDMLAMCMDGGMSLSASLEQVARRMNHFPAIAQELRIVRRQADVSSLQTALADFSRRVDLPELRSLVTLLTRGDRLGTHLTGSLMDQSDHLRTGRRQRANLQANKTPVKLVLPLIFCFAPAALILLIAPAVLELREFFAPSAGSTLSGNDQLQTDQIFRALDELEQDINQ
ncbi:MAG: type II secretion system F family protein [Pirellulales bacterium]